MERLTDNNLFILYNLPSSGAIHHFWKRFHLDRHLYVRQPPFSNGSYFVSIDDENHLLEYGTPDGLHSLAFKYDIHGNVVQISADAENVFFSYAKRSGTIQVRYTESFKQFL